MREKCKKLEVASIDDTTRKNWLKWYGVWSEDRAVGGNGW